MKPYDRFLINQEDNARRAEIEELVSLGRYVVVEETYLAPVGTMRRLVADHGNRYDAEAQARMMNDEDMSARVFVLPEAPAGVPYIGAEETNGEELPF